MNECGCFPSQTTEGDLWGNTRERAIFLSPPEFMNGHVTPAVQSLGQCASPLSAAFFSRENINAVQVHLRNRVRCKTGYTIGRQSEETLLIIMRAIFALHSRNVVADVPREVARINELVLAEIVPMAAGNLAQYLGYLRDASTMYTPIARGVNTSSKGTDVYSLFPSM